MPLEQSPLDIALDDGGELDIVDGDVRLAAGLEGVSQGIRVRLLLFKGEWFLDLDAGTPWRERDGIPASAAILGQRYNEARVRSILREAILDTEDDLELVKLDLSFNSTTRLLSVSWTVRVSFSDTLIQGELTMGA
jgi:hypothetical protein